MTGDIPRTMPPGKPAEPTLWLGPLRLNLHTNDVTVNNTPLALTRKEYSVLELLILRRGSVLEKEALLEHLYGRAGGPKTKMIDIFVCKLRKKLATVGLPNVIGTAWGKGYVLCDPDQHANATPFGTGDRLR
jgi:two-component system cell cycle response regulator CtrA